MRAEDSAKARERAKDHKVDKIQQDSGLVGGRAVRVPLPDLNDPAEHLENRV
jgi:hypothetical protein